MKLFRVFNVPQHSRFKYIPRYYDPDKEALEKRLKEVEERKGNHPDAMKSRISEGIRRGYGDRSIRKKNVLKSNLVILGLVIVLCIVAFFFINLYLPRILESL